jgi:hypothetical protein
MSWFTKTVLAFVIVDVCLVLFLSYGAVFPKRMTLPDPREAQAAEFYDFSAKGSPVAGGKVSPKRVITARASFGELGGGQ